MRAIDKGGERKDEVSRGRNVREGAAGRWDQTLFTPRSQRGAEEEREEVDGPGGGTLTDRWDRTVKRSPERRHLKAGTHPHLHP